MPSTPACTWDAGTRRHALLEDQLDDAVGVNRITLIGVAGPFYARRGRLDLAERLLREGRTRIEPLVDAQFTAPVLAGLAELALTSGRPAEASRGGRTGIERLERIGARYYDAELLMMGARAEADVADVARARRDQAEADQAARVAARLRRADARGMSRRRPAAMRTAAASRSSPRSPPRRRSARPARPIRRPGARR